MAQTFQIIKNRSKFIHIREKGKFIRGKCFNLQLLEDKDLNQIICVGFIATKKIGNAVMRNKAKRIMRELAKKILINGKINSYYVLIAKPSLLETSFDKLIIELKGKINEK